MSPVPMAAQIPIRQFARADEQLYREHFGRHRSESGRGDYHFMPFAPDDPNGPLGVKLEKLDLPLSVPGWQRYWLALDPAGSRVIGHVDLKGSALQSALHRCELGIGIERQWRNQGLGRRLMQTAIEFARLSPSLAWIDLYVFEHNQNAAGLYESLGFRKLAVIEDYFRIEGKHISDIVMTLNVE